MNKLTLIAALIVILALLVWLLRKEAPAVETRDEPAAHVAPPPVEAVPTPLVAADGEAAEREVVREAEPPAAPKSEVASAPPSEPAASRRSYDPDAREQIHLIVQDKLGAPIANAEIRMTGLRTPRDPGSHWGWFLEPSIGRTEMNGTASLWFPVWINADLETGSVSLSVQHPEYITHDEQDFEIGPEPRVIVLEQGAFIVVSGWFESPSDVVTDIVPHMTWGAKIQPDVWLPIKDGRLSCASVPPGKHGIYLSCTDTERGAHFSEALMFEIGAGEQKEVHLQLFPSRTFEGRIDPAVPRPIVNGAVRINLQIGERSAPNATMLREYEARVNADGSFAFTDLPPGDGQIIGQCDGWVSLSVPAGREYLWRVEGSDGQIEEMLASLDAVPQSIPADTSGVPYVLRMAPAATLQATIVDEAGKPIEGVKLTLWPNVLWRTGYSNLFMQRVCEGTSDEHGRVTISNVPSGHIYGGAQHGRYAIPENEQGRRRLDAEFEPGKTLEMRVELVPIELK